MEEEKDNKQTPKMEIEINQYKNLVKTFNNPKALAKIIIVVAVVITLVFVGIAAVALAVKHFYPYNSIKSNKYGATVIRNEDGDVTYWLFNSADLWSNSGIEVKKGDIISIRTSGAFHTAVHRLVDAAKENKVAISWLSPTGGVPSKGQESENRDIKRSDFRICPESNADFNVILMQVLPKEYERLGREWYKKNPPRGIDSITFNDQIDGGMKGERSTANIYIIGDQHENIEIQEDGVLYFTCNDIALTHRKIKAMQKYVKPKYITYKKDGKTISEKKDTGVLRIGKHPSKPNLTELDYYYDSNYVNAWFDDNVGSFLIVVERKNNK